MKKSILFVIMLVFLSTNLYAEELHYHEKMWCLKPDGTPNGRTEIKDGVTLIMIPDAGTSSEDELIKKSLQDVYAVYAENLGFPKAIPSKKIEYTLHDGAEIIEVNPISQNQVLLITYAVEGGFETPVLLTYNPSTKTTRATGCYSLP